MSSSEGIGRPDASITAAVVTARFPPMESTGTIRVGTLREHLGDFDVRATYVTIPPAWVINQQPDIDTPIPLEPDALYPTAPWDPLIRAMSRVPLLRRLQRWLLIPDILVSWAKHGANSVAQELDVDVVYATGPPFSAFVAGRILARKLEVPLVLELRDPPLMDRRAGERGSWYLRRLASFERHQVLFADAVVTLTPGVKSYLLDTYPELDRDRVSVIPNGAPPTQSLRGPDRSPILRVLYAGSLRSHADFEVLSTIAACLASLETTAQLRLVGNFPDSAAAMIGRDSPGSVVVVGRVSREDAIEEMRSCDVSLVLAGAEESWWIGRKVIESLVHAPRILALAPEGDLTELLGRSAKSLVLPREAAASEIQAALRSFNQRSPQLNSGSRSEPTVPTDSDVARAIASLMRSLVRGGHGEDWEW